MFHTSVAKILKRPAPISMRLCICMLHGLSFCMAKYSENSDIDVRAACGQGSHPAREQNETNCRPLHHQSPRTHLSRQTMSNNNCGDFMVSIVTSNRISKSLKERSGRNQILYNTCQILLPICLMIGYILVVHYTLYHMTLT